MDVKAARGLGGFRPKQSREAAWLRLGLIGFQLAGERVELADELRLSGVGFELAPGDERAIAFGDAGHARAPSPRGRRWPAKPVG